MITVIEQRLLKKIYAGLEQQDTNLNALYFGYGANAYPPFFLNRIKNASFIGPATLNGYKLNFSTSCEYKGKGFAGISESINDQVYGGLYAISNSGQELLDVLEWVKFGFYTRLKLPVVTNSDQHIANIYVPTYPVQNLVPSPGYLDLLVKGAVETNSPKHYIDFLKSHPSKNQFKIDHNFNLRNPSQPRALPGICYRIHDRLREKLCTLI